MFLLRTFFWWLHHVWSFIHPVGRLTLTFDLPLHRVSSFQSFSEILNEMNDYAGQREVIAENMMTGICVELTKYLQDLKSERKTVS